MNEQTALYVLLGAIGGWVLLVNFFVAIMHTKAVLDRGEKIPGLFRLPLYLGAVVGLILDIAFNWTLGIVIYREPPQEFTFTSRCSRHKQGHGWRKEKAEWWCKQLNKFDPGHC
jgi:hypothetical protein